jgi:hypothetical protein
VHHLFLGGLPISTRSRVHNFAGSPPKVVWTCGHATFVEPAHQLKTAVRDRAAEDLELLDAALQQETKVNFR